MSAIKFRLAAKTDMGLVRTNNEDNFQIVTDLSSGKMQWVNNEICSLGDKGALLVVADGMGGMNAGEVASGLVIETIREYFSPENLTPDVTRNRFSIEKYMNDVIVAADTRIKQMAKEHPETRGMGTTVVIGWIFDGYLYVSWCGDSRAYVYNPAAGLHQITKDHSYVQSLVDKGAITREDAFDYPDSNIITRSLGDTSSKAKPESLLKPYRLCDNDIILLCTDGLSGMIRDSEMESVIRNNEHNMDTLADDLIKAACDAEGSDNITICLCQILQGGAVCNPAVFDETERRLEGRRQNTVRPVQDGECKPAAKKGPYIVIVCLSLVIVGLIVWHFTSYPASSEKDQDDAAMEMPAGAKEAPEESPVGDVPLQEAGNDNDVPVENKPDRQIENKGKRDGKKQEEAGVSPEDESGSVEEEETRDELTPIGRIGEAAEVEAIGGETEVEAGNNGPADTLYVVKKGDTYLQLSRLFGIGVDELKKLNGEKELKAGDTLRIPIRKQ